jgi:hypothetical protein
MRLTQTILSLTGALLLTGCSTLVSLNPFISEQEAGFDAALLGTWHDDDGNLYVIDRIKDHYAITYLEKSSAMRFEGWLLEIADAKLLDLESSDEDPFQIAIHLPLRVWSDGSTLRFAFLDSDWLKQQAIQDLSAQVINDRTLITGPSAAARAFLAKLGADTRAHSEVRVLHKVQ